MLWTVNYYDDKGRVQQSFKQHYLGGAPAYNTNNYDAVKTAYNFDNSFSATYRYHYVNGSQALRMDNAYFYDHAGRKSQTWQAINNISPSILLNQEEYNEIGQLKKKSLHSEDNGGSFLQQISYSYNERGWTNHIGSAYFDEVLRYDHPLTAGVQAQYNGNIAEQQYTAQISGTQTVTYGYDELNRLKDGISSAGFSENNIQYDNLGNITSLTRNNYGTLGYNYTNGSQLASVSGFVNGSYLYDENGNTKSDGTKSNTITYNMLNLPRNIAGANNISYTYDIEGTKLSSVNGGVRTDYISGIQYDTNGNIEFVQMEDGRAIKSGASFNYEYTLTDHLGNTRVTFDRTNGKVGEEDYYPFGLNVHRQTNAGNKYLYNNKELQDGLNQYDYGARFYDPVIARFTSIDPHAETYSNFSSYAYCFNNPMKYIDPDGRDGRLTGTGTKDDPYVIQAAYIYGKGSLPKDQVDGLNAAVEAYNGMGVTTVKDNDGSKVFVKYNLSTVETIDVDDAKSKTMFKTENGDDRFYGNIVGTKPFDGTEFGSANNNRVDFNIENITAGVKGGMRASSLNKATAIHELGHNLGGEHDDGTNTMQNMNTETTTHQIGGYTTKLTTYPTTDNKFTQIIFQRRDSKKSDPHDGRIWTQKK